MGPRYLLALSVLLAGCGSVSGPAATDTPQPTDTYVVGPMSPQCPSHDGRGTHYPPTERRSHTVPESWSGTGEARRLAENWIGHERNLTVPDGRFDAIGWTGEYVDIEDRWTPDRHRVFEAADGSDYAVLVLGYENRTVLETFSVASYC